MGVYQCLQVAPKCSWTPFSGIFKLFLVPRLFFICVAKKFDQQTACEANVRWLKYSTNNSPASDVHILKLQLYREDKHCAKMTSKIVNRFSYETSNDIIAENGRVLKAYMFLTWLYLFKKL